MHFPFWCCKGRLWHWYFLCGCPKEAYGTVICSGCCTVSFWNCDFNCGFCRRRFSERVAARNIFARIFGCGSGAMATWVGVRRRPLETWTVIMYMEVLRAAVARRRRRAHAGNMRNTRLASKPAAAAASLRARHCSVRIDASSPTRSRKDRSAVDDCHILRDTSTVAGLELDLSQLGRQPASRACDAHHRAGRYFATRCLQECTPCLVAKAPCGLLFCLAVPSGMSLA